MLMIFTLNGPIDAEATETGTCDIGLKLNYRRINNDY